MAKRETAMTLRSVLGLLIAAFLVAPLSAVAQSSNPPASAPSDHRPLKPEELDALVAPIALYPDNLLSQVLMASTFPLEVVQAERWLQANKKLTGDQVEAAVAKQDWDDSIKSLLATPSVLDMMSGKLDWTQKLGDAVIAQQPDVMDAVQRLRAKAQSNNKLTTTKQQKVTVSQSQGRQYIAIEPTDPGTMYVPYYDPAVMYGPWPYPAYPPYYWPAPGYIGAGILATGLAFGAGYALGRWASGGYWGGSVNWNSNNITVNRPGGGGGNWNRGAHVEHRTGNRGPGGRQMDFRGRNGQQVLNPGGGRNHAATRPSGGNRNHAATRPSGGRGTAGNRHGGNRVQQRAGGGGRAHAANRAGRGGGGARVGGGGRGGGHARAGGGHRGGGGGGGHARAGGGHRGGGGGGGGGGRGGGRRSDIRLKHDIVLLGHLDNGLGLYRFVYNGAHKAYVGVMAQEVERVMPQAVERGADGYLRVHYEKIGVTFESYDQWLRSARDGHTAVGWQ
jgi:hypothetical protein